MQRRHLLRRGAAAAALLATAMAGPAAALAQGAPPIRILVGATPGGSTDTLAREIAPDLGKALDRIVIVENKSGAGGNLAAEAVARAEPDGNTLLLSFTSHTINATLYPKLPFDPVADFTPLTLIATTPSVLVAHPSFPASDVQGLIDYARKNPGRVSMAIGGIGSSLHLAGEALKMRARIEMVNIPYRGTSPAIADVVAGTVPVMVAPVGNTRKLIEAGKLKALGVTSPEPIEALPGVAPIARTLPGYESSAWFGLFGPKGMDAALARRLSDAARGAVQSEAFRQRLALDGGRAVGNAPEEFARFVAADVPRWAELVKFSGATPE